MVNGDYYSVVIGLRGILSPSVAFPNETFAW